jgi:hypothetical protein
MLVVSLAGTLAVCAMAEEATREASVNVIMRVFMAGLHCCLTKFPAMSYLSALAEIVRDVNHTSSVSVGV